MEFLLFLLPHLKLTQALHYCQDEQYEYPCNQSQVLCLILNLFLKLSQRLPSAAA